MGAEKKTEVKLHELDITGVAVTLTTNLQASQGVPGAKIPAPPIKFADFEEKFGDLDPADMMQTLMTQILVSARDAVIKNGVDITGQAGSAITSVTSTVSGLLG